MDERAALRTLAHAIRQRLYLFIAVVAALTVVAGVAATVRPASYPGTAALFVAQPLASSDAFAAPLPGGQPPRHHSIRKAANRGGPARAGSGSCFRRSATS